MDKCDWCPYSKKINDKMVCQYKHLRCQLTKGDIREIMNFILKSQRSK